MDKDAAYWQAAYQEERKARLEENSTLIIALREIEVLKKERNEMWLNSNGFIERKMMSVEEFKEKYLD